MTAGPKLSQWPADLSPDGRYRWNGSTWELNPVSPDGRYFWYQDAWRLLPAPHTEGARGSTSAAISISSRPLSQLVGQPLVWRGSDNHAVLQSGEEVFATLSGNHPSTMKGPGVFEAIAYDGRWTFEQPSSLRTGHVVIRDQAGTVLWEFNVRTIRKMGFDLPRGGYAALRFKNRFYKSWEWIDGDGNQLMFLDRFAMTSWKSFVEEREVRIQPAAASIADLSLLALLGQYLSRTAELSSE